MRYQVRGRRAPVPSISTAKAQTNPIDYKKGWYSGVPNDLQPDNTLRYVTDMRFDGIGKYKTRKGNDEYSVPIGEAVNVQVTSTTGASDAGFSTSTWIAEKLTATATGPLTKVDVNIKNSASATGTPIIAVYDDDSGSPGTLLATSSIVLSDITNSYAYLSARFIEGPTITNTEDYWVVTYLQTSGTGTMYVSSTTNSTNAKTSSDMGQSWSAAAYSLNIKLYTATAGGVKGLRRIYRPSGQGTTFFAHGTTLYSVNDSTGATTSVDTSLSSGVVEVRFEYVNDVLYYTDGIGKPRKWDFSSAASVTTAPGNASNVMEHVGLLFYFDADDPTKVFFTNFADYETFTSTDFIYVPAPKKSDHLKAMAKLNGVLYFFTRRNKHMLLGQDNATFRLDEAYAQKGTFSQESVVFDENYIYFASDDGIYRFNGTSEKNIAEGIIDDYTAILTKDDIHLQLFNNRLYIWYRPNGQADVTECFVYNTLYDVWEGRDLNTHISKSHARHDTTGLFLQASNKYGAVFYGELPTNDYNNLGKKIEAEVRTTYDHFGTPQQVKRITYWRPIIESVSGSYSMQAGFAANQSEDVNYVDVAIQSTGYTYDDASSLYDSATYASSSFGTDMTLNIYGSAYRWQRRYKHHAVSEPFIFAGEVLTVETQRLR